MAKLSVEEIQSARSVTVLDYLREYEPGELIRVGLRDYRTKTHDSLVVSDNGLFHWFSTGLGGGNAIDYLIKVKRMDFVSAVRLLNEHRPTVSSFQIVNSNTALQIEKREFVRPTPDCGNNAIRAYLFRRAISNRVFRYCNDAGILYQTTRGEYKNCVFLGLDVDGEPRAAFVRSCNGVWRGDSVGSQKKYGFCIPAKDRDCDTVEIYESPIDAMSGATLRQVHKREDWRSVYYLSLGGLNYQPIDYFLETHPIARVRLCLDNDKRGREFAEKLSRHLVEQGYKVFDCPPKYGKDYNDQLVHEMHLRFRQAERE